MADTKKEWANTPLAEKIVRIAIQALCFIIGGILPYFAYFVPKENSYPATWIADDNGIFVAIVWTVYAVFIIMISGVIFYIPNIDDDAQPWKGITFWSGVAAALGLIILAST